MTALVHRRQAIAASPRPALRVAAEPGAATGLLGRIRVERRRMIEAGEPAEIVALAVDAGAAWTGP